MEERFYYYFNYYIIIILTILTIFIIFIINIINIINIIIIINIIFIFFIISITIIIIIIKSHLIGIEEQRNERGNNPGVHRNATKVGSPASRPESATTPSEHVQEQQNGIEIANEQTAIGSFGDHCSALEETGRPLYAQNIQGEYAVKGGEQVRRNEVSGPVEIGVVGGGGGGARVVGAEESGARLRSRHHNGDLQQGQRLYVVHEDLKIASFGDLVFEVKVIFKCSSLLVLDLDNVITRS